MLNKFPLLSLETSPPLQEARARQDNLEEDSNDSS
jgi:hypothetical protein